jgi:putative ABC transport system permease protein
MLTDLRQTIRSLMHRPGFTAVAVVTLALGIGGTTAIFSLVDTLMLRELPYPDADRVMTLWQDNAKDGIPRDELSPANFFDWRERNRAFEVMAAADPFSFDLTGDGPPETLFGVLVTEGFFDVLRVRPHLGRTFLPEDHAPGSGTTVMLTFQLWQRRFGGDPGLVGGALRLDGEPAVVVGVLPPEFELGMLPTAGERGVWGARTMQGWESQARGSVWWNAIGRLKPGVTREMGEADLDRVSAELAREYPGTNEGIGAAVVPLHEHLVGSARTALLVLLGAVVAVLLIACVNVANLLLVRGAEREGELALRSALGADRGRLVHQLLGESVVLASLGGAAGVVIAFWGVDVVKRLGPGDIPRLDAVTVDVRVLLFTLGLTLATAVLFGLLPAIQSSRPRLRDALQEARATVGRGRRRLRNAFVVAETALALMLLIGAALLTRSFVSLIKVDPGFAKDNLLALQVFYWNNEDTYEDRIRFFDETVRRIEALPGVQSAGAVSAAPFLEANIGIRRAIVVEGAPEPRPGEEPQVYVTVATPGYFGTVGVPLLRGRPLTDRDDLGAPGVALIIEEMWRRHWPNQDPVGRTFRLGAGPPVGTDSTSIEIVGVVGDVRHEGFDSPPRPEAFFAQAQAGFGSMTYFVRTAARPAPMIETVKQEIWALAPLQTFYRTATVDELVSRTLAPRRFVLVLLGAFAAMALVMAAVGIYGVMSYAVNRRTHEVGIRMALGADHRSVLRMVVGQGMALTMAGVAVGLVAAFAGTRLMTSLLFNVPPRDTIAFSLGVAVLAGAAFLASYVPARRATRVDPMEALRSE